MVDLDLLKKFGNDEGKKAKDKLAIIINNIREQSEKCQNKLNENREILVENSENTENRAVLQSAEDLFRKNVTNIIEIYTYLLEHADDAGIKIRNNMELDLNDVSIDEEKTQEHFEKAIREGYSNIVGNFEKSCDEIFKFCDVLYIISDNYYRILRENGNEAHTLIYIYTKFILPMGKIVEILEETVKQKEKLSPPIRDPNNDNSESTTCEKMIAYVKKLMEYDYIIRQDQINIHIIARNGHNLGDSFEHDLNRLMIKYHELNSTHNLPLMQYKLSNIYDELSKEKLKDYLEEYSKLVGSLKKFFNACLKKLGEIFPQLMSHELLGIQSCY